MLERLTLEDLIANANAYDRYRSRLVRGNPDGWPSSGFQRANFEQLVKIEGVSGVSLVGSRCLDVGCGTGEMAPYLEERGVRSYEGIDVRKDAVLLARKKYPFSFFHIQDLLTKSKDERFDFIFCSGAMTARIPSGNGEYMSKMVRKMWALARVGVAFNYLVPGRVTEDDYCHLFSRGDVLEVLASLRPSVRGFSLAHEEGQQQDTIIVTKV